MSEKVILLNSVGKDDNGFYIIHSPSRWSQGVKDLSSWFAYYPWELAYSSSLLKKNTDCIVKLIDPCLNRWDKNQTLQVILQEEPDWLIIESSTRTINENLWVARQVKKEKKDVCVVFAGQHASVYPRRLLTSGVDYVLYGEYEYTLLELIQKKGSEGILGVYPNPPRPLLDFSQLPWPEDEDVSRLSYGLPGEPSSEYLEIQAYASRGCVGDCNFCVGRNIYFREKKWRPRDIDDIIEEIKYLKAKYPWMEGIFFDEEAHNISKNFILNLCGRIKESGLQSLKYEAMCDIRFLDEQMLNAMREAGYYKIRFGIETADSACGERIGKKIDIKKTIQILRYSKKIGLKNYGTFMFGLPGSDTNIERKTINLMEFLIHEGLLDNVQLSIITPLPGTPFYYWAKNCGYIREEKPEHFDGGNTVILNYPDYTYNQIEENYLYALALRDHLYFRKNLFHPLLFFKTRYKKYGLKLIFKKLLRRIKIELDFLRSKIVCYLVLLVLWNINPSRAQIIKLPPPELKSNISLEEAIVKRRSIRNFSIESLTLNELSQLLWAVAGKKIDAITSATGNYPSAGGIYGIKIYVYASNIKGLNKGLYSYHDDTHTLELLSKEDISQQLSTACLNQKFIAKAPCVFIFLGDIQRYISGYGKRGIRYMYIDLGHCAQNLYLKATSLNLGTVAVGAFYDEALYKLLNCGELQPLYIMPVGRLKQ